MPILENPKHEIFARERARGRTQEEAARIAGYKGKQIAVTASKLANKSKVAQRIIEIQEQASHRAELSVARVLEEIRRVAFADLGSFYDKHGNVLALPSLSAEQRACLAGSETILKNAAAGDGEIDKIHKIRLWDKTKALEMLAKHFGLFKPVEADVSLTIKWQDEP